MLKYNLVMLLQLVRGYLFPTLCIISECKYTIFPTFPAYGGFQLSATINSTVVQISEYISWRKLQGFLLRMYPEWNYYIVG